MSKYTGVRCPVCSKKFASADDVVVCPVCGAPHHRNCYMEKGECVFQGEHITGKEWEAPRETPTEGEEPARPATKRCPGCGSHNPADSIYCQTCGNRLAAAHGTGEGQRAGQVFQSWVFPNYDGQFDADTMVYGGLKPEDTIDGQRVGDVAVYVGSSTSYFLPRFKMFSDGAHAVSANFGALIFSYFYFFYRKMYLVGALLLALSVASMAANFVTVREMLPQLIHDPSFAPFVSLMEQWDLPINLPSEEVNQETAKFYDRIYRIARMVNFCARMALAMFANYLYYRKVMKSMNVIRTRLSEAEGPRYQSVLAVRGGVSNMNTFAAAFTMAVAYYCIYALVFQGIF